ncbi:MAG: hypothetical protein DMG70_12775 [Acidobacteria bacterium]|nr:MAG: hypothetical protein DMG70_12775 [Acidobacteriota bacterium]PYY12313.1 MAG: hypothetical protein DMG69_01575 [Acidobacteriota bacterium]
MSTILAPGARLRSQAKLVFFVVFGLVTVSVTYMKNARILDPSSDTAQHFAPVKWYLVAHAFFGATAMLLGVFQFSNRLRARYLKLHRVLGYVYVVSVFISAPLAIPVASRIDSLSLAAASGVQSFGWMVTTAVALYCIRHGNIAQHRRWMVRSYPFAMVFTVARIIIPIPAILRMGFTGIEMVVWTTIAMAAFLPNIVLEWRAIVTRPRVKAVAAD